MIKLKDIIKEAKWSDRKWGDPLPTLEDYIVEFTKNLKPSDGSKEVTFTNKDNYDKAVKSGDYEEPDDSGGGEKEEPSGKLGTGDFERETEPERGEKPKAKRSDRYKDVDTSWQDDPEAAAAQGQQGMQPGQAEPKGDEEPSGEPEDGEEPSDEPSDNETDELESALDGLAKKHNVDPDDDERFSHNGSDPAGFHLNQARKYIEMIRKGDSVMYAPDSSGKPYKMDDKEKDQFRSKIASQIRHMEKAAGKEEPDTGGGDLDTQIATAEKEFQSAAQAAQSLGSGGQGMGWGGDSRYDDAADDALKKLKALKAKKDGKKESITINGKQYKRISESVEPTIFDPLKEAKKQLGGLYSRMIGK
jgi:hypothetical protein